MIILPTPTSSWVTHKASLAGKTYKLTYRFNEYQQRWMLDIYLNDTPVILGQMIIEGSILFYGKPIKDFDHGVIVPLRNREGTSKIGKDNLGIDKEFSLYYLSNEEWADV